MVYYIISTMTFIEESKRQSEKCSGIGCFYVTTYQHDRLGDDHFGERN